MPTFASLFSGGGGADIGARNAGYTLAWGLEIDERIAWEANRNLGGHIRVGDILESSLGDFSNVDLLHASPECPNFSVANHRGGESDKDIAMAGKVAEFIRYLRPRFFTLENVGKYRKSQSYSKIVQALNELGYIWDAGMINSADYGVPQTRRRLWLRASRSGLLPNLPPKEKRIGWYEAIEDLIPTLPESRFAKWQLSRLPQAMIDKFVGPILTFIVPGDNANSFDIYSADHPARTVGSVNRQSNTPKAFIVDGRNGRFDGGNLTVLGDKEPVFTNVSSNGPNRHKAFLLDDQNGAIGKTEDNRGLTIRDEEQPSHTVSASQNKRSIRAWYISDQQNPSGDGGIPIRDSDSPALTVPSANNPKRAWLENGRVVAMTPRALARFQTFPDRYELPEKTSLACKIIGNAVPCLLYEKLALGFRSLI